jgi:hypothetical protein
MVQAFSRTWLLEWWQLEGAIHGGFSFWWSLKLHGKKDAVVCIKKFMGLCNL